MKKSLLLITALFLTAISFASTINGWTDVNSNEGANYGKADIKVTSARLMQIDLTQVSNLLNQAPLEFTNQKALEISLPTPNGGQARFAIFETVMMEEGLATKYPGIKTWVGQGIDSKSATVRIDITYLGFHAMILDGDETVFIDPYNRTTTSFVQVYYRKDAINSHPESACGFNGESEENIQRRNEIEKEVIINGGNNSSARSIAGTLRTYRLALACTGEYAAFFGGTVPATLSAMVTSINRVNGVYEKEVDIRMVLIQNTDTLIFLNAATDPYDNNNGGTMLGQNQTTINAYIGSANYDFGHVFSTGGGGIAQLGCICGSSKAQGVTGSPSPVGDPFDIDYVAHEMGHQFGGNHTFNGNTGSCSGNRNSTTAYEPGSGSSIMAYAGICSPQDIASHSDPVFHTASFDEIVNYSTLANGNTCAVQTATGNNAPIITSIGSNYTIPISTPFSLTGAANDPDGDTLTYSWEQYDLGPAGAPSTPSGNAPLFRSLNPLSVPTRIFPRINFVLSNGNSLGEKLPTYARSIKFRFTARDNKVAGGGVTYDPNFVTLTVSNNGAPFQVTSPNTAVNWPALSIQNITWDVANTDLSPISCATVDVLLSTDGGVTFPTVLGAGVPNTGLLTVTLPNVTTTTARVMVKSVGNIFFDICNRNFTISAPVSVAENELLNQSVSIFPNPANGAFSISWAGDYKGNIALNVTDIQGRSIRNQQITKSNSGIIVPVDLTNIANGVYFVTLNSTMGNITRKLIIE